jgi:probable FeS assembly SUF system protein SufT
VDVEKVFFWSNMSITILQLDVKATMVPSGHDLMLKAGTPIRITREKGGSITAEVFGNLILLREDAYPALGKTLPKDHHVDESLSFEDQVVSQLKRCYDPEIPVNVYDLGLIYQIGSLSDQGALSIEMTLTSPTCGMGPFILGEVEKKLKYIPGINEVKVDLVFDPPWQKHMMTKSAQLALGVL